MKRFIGITLLLCIIEFCLNAYVGDIPRAILWLILSLTNAVGLAVQIGMDEFEKKWK